MEPEHVQARLKQLLPKGHTLSKGHLAELLRDDPVMRLAPYLALVDEAVSNGLLEETDSPEGPVLKTVAQDQSRQREREP